MKAAAFDYVRPRELGEALHALKGAEARLIAGGQSLGPMLNLRLARPKLLVDVSRIDALRQIKDEGDAWRIGAAVTHAELEDRPLERCAPLSTVARVVAYRAVRNRGTVGGSLAHADPAADWPLVFAALDAKVRVTGPAGTRELRADSLMSAPFTTLLAEDEIIDSVRVPKSSSAARWGYYKFCRKTGEFPDAAAALLLDPERRVARLFVGALDGPPQPLDNIARAVAEHGSASAEMISASLARIAPGLGPGARKLRATAVQRAIAQA